MKILSLDIEGAYGIMHPYEEGFYTACVGMVTNEGNEKIVWIEHSKAIPTKNGIAIIQQWVDEADLMVGQNLKYDMCALMHYGVDFSKVKIWDTMVAEYLLSGQNIHARRFSLEAIAQWYEIPGKKGDKVNMYWDDGVDTKDIPEAILSEYQIQDCYVPLNIYYMQHDLAVKHNMLKLIELQCEFTLCLADMEYNGVNFDQEVAERIESEYRAKANEVQEQVRLALNEPKLDLGSLVQRSAALYGGVLKLCYKEWVTRELKVRPETLYYERTIRTEHPIKGLGFRPPKNPKLRNKNGYYKVNHDTIADLPTHTKALRKWKEIILDYATYRKIHQTLKGKSYKTGLMRKCGIDGKVHPELNQTSSKTGRLTSKNPNGQNLFSAIKICFKPSLDYIGQVDLSQVEWRGAGELAQDEVIIREVNEGVDQHIDTCTNMMELPFKNKQDPESKKNRDHAKVFNFRMIYGGSYWGFHLDIDMPDFGIKKWKKIIKTFFKKYWRLNEWHVENIRHVLQKGFLRLPTGRWFQFHKIVEEEGEKTYSYNQIKNYPVQGLAGGDILPLTAVIIRRGMIAMGLLSKMILTVHDSIVFDIAKGEEDRLKDLCLKTCASLREYIQAYFGIPWRTYLEGEFEIGTNYKELREVKLNQSCKEVLNEVF